MGNEGEGGEGERAVGGWSVGEREFLGRRIRIAVKYVLEEMEVEEEEEEEEEYAQVHNTHARMYI